VGYLIGECDQEGNLIAEHIWLGDAPVAVVKPEGGTGLSLGTAEAYLVHSDHLNALRAVVDAQNRVFRQRDSRRHSGTGGVGRTENRLQSALFGKYCDAESGGIITTSRIMSRVRGGIGRVVRLGRGAGLNATEGETKTLGIKNIECVQNTQKSPAV